MRLNMSFNVTVETKRFKTGETEDAGENVDLEFVMTALDAGLFLFKVSKNVFEYSGYKVYIATDNLSGEIKGIAFNNDEYSYVVRSKNKFMSDILDGYEKIRLLEKMAGIAEYAQSQLSAPDEDDILDEFDDNVHI